MMLSTGCGRQHHNVRNPDYPLPDRLDVFSFRGYQKETYEDDKFARVHGQFTVWTLWETKVLEALGASHSELRRKSPANSAALLRFESETGTKRSKL
jgi:hypothetical protein